MKVRILVICIPTSLTVKPAWTIAHAFFVIMGGYHAYNGNDPLYPLDPTTVINLVSKGGLVPPRVDELSDKSKGDLVSKTAVILQTIWFVAQCVARPIKHLPLTNLEVMTVAYTVMTVAMFLAWWNKPLNIASPIRVSGTPVETQPNHVVSKHFASDYILGAQDDRVDLRCLHHVPTFWAGRPKKNEVISADIVALFTAIIFGAVHCAAWFSTFPSNFELQMWRASAGAIIAIPAAILASLLLSFKVERWGMNDVWIFLFYGFSLIGATIYICARLILLTLSLTTLRLMPSPVYQTVQWTQFIPHI